MTCAIFPRRLTTAYGTELFKDRCTKGIVHLGPDSVGLEAERYAPVVFIAAPHDPRAAFMSAEDAFHFEFDGECWDQPVLSYRLLTSDRRSNFNLRHPRTGAFLSVESPEADGVGLVSCTRRDRSSSECFKLSEASCAPRLQAVLTSLGKIPPDPIGAQSLLDWLQHVDASDAAVFAACVRYLPINQFRRFANSIVNDAAAVDTLARLFPGETWVWNALEELRGWEASGRPIRQRLDCGREFAFLDQDRPEHDQGGAGRLIDRFVREESSPRKTSCILTCVRNEGLDLVEWLAYHRILGFEHVFIYANDNTDGSDPLLQALAAANCITLIDNDLSAGGRPQYKAYGHALKVLPDILDFRWVALLDADEFVRIDPEKFNSIADFLAWHENEIADSIALRWRLLGANGMVRWDSRLMTEKFSESIQDNCPLVKSIFKTNRFSHGNPHFPSRPGTGQVSYRTSSGEAFTDKSVQDADNFTHAWIDHFYFKSLEEVLVRRTQTAGDVIQTAAVDFGRLDERVCDWIASTYDGRCPPHHQFTFPIDMAVRKEVDRLLKLPGVMEGQQKAISGFKSILRNVLTKAAEEPRFRKGGNAQWIGEALSLYSDD